MKPTTSLAFALICTALLAVPINAQDDLQRRGPRPGGGGAGGAGGGLPQAGPSGAFNQASIKPYEDVVTKDAKTQDGVFQVHRVKENVLWEIPAKLYGRVFLWQTEVAEVPEGPSYPGIAVGTHVVYFERHENSIYLREQHYDVRTHAKDGLALGVAMTNISPILAAFPIQAEGKDKAAVIDVTRLFTSDQAPFSASAQVGASGVDLSRSYIDRVSDFPTNIETRSMLTFSSPQARTALIHYSLDLLPEKPMKPRFRDDRVGFFGTSFTMYGLPDEKAVSQTYIDRFRLEKRDPDQAVSEPVKPIVFYLSREMPDKWRPWIKIGIENWNQAFLKAGFKNAIICKNAPSIKQDPTWDPEDARYSVIRWEPSTTANAQGPHVADPRSGETISAHVIVWHNVLNLVQQWYFSQASVSDPRARHLPLPDSVMGPLIEYVVSHEVGHTLGLEHNFKASTAFTTKQLRTPGFVAQNGVAASIMSYSRFNYVAQPGDGVSRQDLLGRIGPYDKFAIAWGYTPIPNASNADAELPTLDKWASQQVDHPELRFGNYLYNEDPETQSECIGHDEITASELGLKNIERAEHYLYVASAKRGENYDSVRDLYNTLMGQRSTEIMRIMRSVGGVVETNYHIGHGDVIFKPIPKEVQADSVKFLMNHGTHMPTALEDGWLIEKIFPDGDVNRTVARQNLIVNQLLDEQRMMRLEDFEARAGANAYTVANLATDVQNGAFDELDAKHPNISVYRRAFQLAYLGTIDARINGASATKTDLNGVERENLHKLARTIDKAVGRAANSATARHLLECRRQIGLIMDGKFPQAAAPAAAPGRPFAAFDMTVEQARNQGCWPSEPWLEVAAGNQ